MVRLLLEVLKDVREHAELHEFVIMPDHLHLLVTPKSDISLERVMQRIKGRFSFRAKKELGVQGEIWQASFKEHRIVDAFDYGEHRRYIFENPVRRGFGENYPYISCRNLLPLDEPRPGLKP
jgi:putative transposase